MNLFDVHFLNVGPYNFWIGFGIILILIGFVCGYFLTFWGSFYFLASNLIIYIFFYLISYLFFNFSYNVWAFSVDNQPLLLISSSTKEYITNMIPLLILIIAIFIFNLLLVLFYFLFVKRVVKNKKVGFFNKTIGSFLGGFQTFVFVCFIMGIIGSGIFYTNSVDFKQNFEMIIKNPSLLNYKSNGISITFFYKFFQYLIY